MNVISSFLSMLFDVSSRRRQGRDADMPTSKECNTMLDLHNKTRSVYDLAPLVISESCCTVAQAHAVWMANAQSVSHLGFSFFGPSQRLTIVGEEPSNIGECISFSMTDDPSAVMKTWFNSLTHRPIILGAYTQFGMGRSCSKDGYNFWCAVYMDSVRTSDAPKLAMSDSLVDVD
jgi:uncharacterized protein YkwD